MNSAELARVLGQLETKVDQALALLHRVDQRVAELERLRWKLTGMALVAGSLGGLAWRVFAA